MGRLVGGQTGQRLKSVMHQRLMESGGWMSRAALADNASTSPPAIDDALADLVMEGKAEFRQAVGYRLAGTELCRTAMKSLWAGGRVRSVTGRQVKDEYRVGVAERRDELGLVMYELALPMPPDGPQALTEDLRQIDAVIKFTQRDL